MAKTNPDLLQEAMDVFAELYDQPDADRRRILDERCGNRPELRREVESLLKQHDEPKMLRDEELDHELKPAGNSASSAGEWSHESVPIARIGRYRLIRSIGEGGMGAVYEAEQPQPRRNVALKLIRPGWVSRDLLKRFRRETHVLGQLDHPGIAQIYEADTAEAEDEEGRSLGTQPYFAMELVRGRTLREYLDQQKPDVTARLELMVGIAEAVHHAHQKGIVHRDLKPGNVMVTDDGRSKILDFGVARLTEGNGQLSTLQTRSGELIGTLAYMSPEQIAGDPHAVDTRADVYALGVILYEMLSERLPLDVTRCSLPEATRMIRDAEPPRLGSINTRFRGDIDTIVCKALEKDVDRRYDSTAAFAADIRRTLRDEPIAARPPSTTYQFRKFARRNRALVSGVAATFLALVIGLIGTIYFAVGLSQQLEETDRQRTLAEARFDDVRELANTLLFEIDEEIRDTPGTTSAREILVSTGLNYLNALSEEADDDDDFLAELAVAYRQLGHIQGSPSRPNLGDRIGAQESYERSIDLLQTICRRNPEDHQMLSQLITSQNALANLLLERGMQGEALAMYESVRDRLAEHQDARGRLPGDLAGDAASVAAHIGRIKMQRGSLDAAVEHFETYLDYNAIQSESQPENLELILNRASMFRQLALTRRRQEMYDDSIEALHHAIDLLDERQAELRDSHWAITLRAAIHRQLGYIYQEKGEYDNVMPHMRQSREQYKRIAAADPDDRRAQRNLGISHFALGYALRNQGHLEQARDEFREYRRIADELARDIPDSAMLKRDLRIALEQLGATLRELGEYAEAQPYLERSVQVAEQLVENSPERIEAQRELTLALENLGHLHVDLLLDDETADPNEHMRVAEALLDRALASIERMETLGQLEARDHKTRQRIRELESRVTSADAE